MNRYKKWQKAREALFSGDKSPTKIRMEIEHESLVERIGGQVAADALADLDRCVIGCIDAPDFIPAGSMVLNPNSTSWMRFPPVMSKILRGAVNPSDWLIPEKAFRPKGYGK
jgi:hypothetical protein